MCIRDSTGGLPQDEFAFSGASGDFNGDGTIDMVMGMPTNQRDGYNSGEGFVINGGDYSDSLIQTGTSGNDLLLGDFNANRLAGGAGDDTIHGLGGADILRGGGGDDVLSITKLDFIMIDGGTGIDTLEFIGHGMDLDMTGFAGASLRSFETIDLSGDGANHLTLNYREIVYLLERQLYTAYGTNTLLTIDGTAQSSLTLEGPWGVMANDGTWVTYALEGIYVKVKAVIQMDLIDWVIPYQGATIDFGADPTSVSVNLSATTVLGANGTDTVQSGTALDGAGGIDTLNTVEVVMSGSGNDLVVGSAGAERFVTGSGNDTVRAGDGRDTLIGGAGVDSLSGEAGADSMDAGDGNDSVWGGAGNDSITGGLGNDTLLGGDTTAGASGNDWLFGDTGNDSLVGGDGADTLLGGEGTDTLMGGAGRDSLDGGVGADVLNGEAGDDTLVYDVADTSVDGGAGFDTLVIRDAVRNLTGVTTLKNFEAIDLRGNADNWLRMGAADMGNLVTDSTTPLFVQGDVGDSLILGGKVIWRTNADTSLDGVVYRAAELYDSANVLKATLRLSSNVQVLIDTATPSSADQLVLGTDAATTTVGAGGNDFMRHSLGADTLDGGDGIDTAEYSDQVGNVYVNLSGSSAAMGTFATVATGTAIDGYGTADTLTSLENIRTGLGNDIVLGNTVANRIVTNAGRDSIDAGAGDDTVIAGEGFDIARGGDGADWIDAGAGHDSVFGDAGNDTLRGGLGNDSLDGGTGNDTVDYSGQTQSVIVNLSSSIQSGVAAGYANDGQGGIDLLTSIEAIVGGAGNDTLVGSSSAETIDGGLGFDVIDAGGGNDTLVYDLGDISVTGGSGTDTLLINDIVVDWREVWNRPAVSAVEVIQFNVEDPQVMYLNKAALVRLTGSTALKIEGNGFDQLVLDVNEWTMPATTSGGYDVYTSQTGGLTLSVASAVHVYETTAVANAAGIGSSLPDSLSGTTVLRGFSANDTLLGTASADTLDGGSGNDRLDGQAGGDSLLGGAGNDTLVWDVARAAGTSDASNTTNISYAVQTTDTLDGGTGFDSLLMGYSSLDFTQPNATNNIDNIELIDLRGRNATSVVLNRASVEAMADSNHVLRVDGDAGDSLFVSDWGLWTYQGEAQVNGGSARIYTAAASTAGETLTLQIGAQLSFINKDVNNSHTNLQLSTLGSVTINTVAAAGGNTDVADVSHATASWNLTDGLASVASAASVETLTTNYRVTDMTIGGRPTSFNGTLDVIDLGSNATTGLGNNLVLLSLIHI